MASVTTQPADDWQVTASAYGWLAGLEGTTGVKGFTSEVDVPFSGILDHLDMTASINLEAQKGRWGGWIDGMYLKVSAGGETPDPLLDIVNVSVTQVAAEAALFYRVWQGDRGSLDLYAGARYMSVKGDLSLSLSDEGVEQVSSNLSARLIDEILSGVKSKAAPVLEAKKAQLTSQLASQAAVLLQDLKAIGESHPRPDQHDQAKRTLAAGAARCGLRPHRRTSRPGAEQGRLRQGCRPARCGPC